MCSLSLPARQCRFSWISGYRWRSWVWIWIWSEAGWEAQGVCRLAGGQTNSCWTTICHCVPRKYHHIADLNAQGPTANQCDWLTGPRGLLRIYKFCLPQGNQLHKRFDDVSNRHKSIYLFTLLHEWEAKEKWYRALQTLQCWQWYCNLIVHNSYWVWNAYNHYFSWADVKLLTPWYHEVPVSSAIDKGVWWLWFLTKAPAGYSVKSCVSVMLFRATISSVVSQLATECKGNPILPVLSPRAALWLFSWMRAFWWRSLVETCLGYAFSSNRVKTKGKSGICDAVWTASKGGRATDATNLFWDE